jgi:hypothetical protein
MEMLSTNGALLWMRSKKVTGRSGNPYYEVHALRMKIRRGSLQYLLCEIGGALIDVRGNQGREGKA